MAWIVAYITPLVELGTKTKVHGQNQFKDLDIFWLHAWLLAWCKIFSHVCICFGLILMHGKLVCLVSVCGGRAGSLLKAVQLQPVFNHKTYSKISVPLQPEKRWQKFVVLKTLFFIHKSVDYFYFALCSDFP